MKPQDFTTKSLEAIAARGSDYRPIAGSKVMEPEAGYQATLYFGHNSEYVRDFVLHVADTLANNDVFEEVAVGFRQVDPEEGCIRVDGLELRFFSGVGSLTLVEPHRSV